MREAVHRNPTIAFATYGFEPRIAADDALAAPLIAEQVMGRVDAVPWDADGIEWERYTAVLIRSTWDYHLRPDRFSSWLESLEARGVPLWNPAHVVRWNADKSYLRELERNGVPIVPTEWLRPGTTPDLEALARRNGWSSIIVKPSVSAGSFRTWLADAGDPA